MKSQMQKPSSGHARYDDEYKRQAVEHWQQSGRSAAKIGAELGVRASLLYIWARKYRLVAQQGGQPVRPEHLEAMRAQIARLTEENAKLLEQREVLKKSLGILSEPPPRGMPKPKR
jgi:transposase